MAAQIRPELNDIERSGRNLKRDFLARRTLRSFNELVDDALALIASIAKGAIISVAFDESVLDQ